MFIETVKVAQTYTRPSKGKKTHTYSRIRTVARFSCDSCQSIFERDLGSMDRRRLSNDYHHVCSNCDGKRFAQKVGAERRRLWNMPVDTDLDITKI